MRYLTFGILLAPSLVAADPPSVGVFHPGGILLIGLDDGGGKLVKLVGSSKQNPVRCYKESDGVIGIRGAADGPVVGCFVGISRAGALVPPPAGKKWSLAHLMPPLDAMPSVSTEADGAIQFTISGSAGDAIGLWTGCDQPAGSAMVCLESNGMLGKFNWDIIFTVAKNGAVRAPKPP